MSESCQLARSNGRRAAGGEAGWGAGREAGSRAPRAAAAATGYCGTANRGANAAGRHAGERRLRALFLRALA
ncbi:hypothetical protein, partial [Burkholderia gladioli]